MSTKWPKSKNLPEESSQKSFLNNLWSESQEKRKRENAIHLIVLRSKCPLFKVSLITIIEKKIIEKKWFEDRTKWKNVSFLEFSNLFFSRKGKCNRRMWLIGSFSLVSIRLNSRWSKTLLYLSWQIIQIQKFQFQKCLWCSLPLREYHYSENACTKNFRGNRSRILKTKMTFLSWIEPGSLYSYKKPLCLSKHSVSNLLIFYNWILIAVGFMKGAWDF